MNLFIKKHFKYIILGIVILAIVLSVYVYVNRKKKKVEIDEIYEIIDSSIGETGKDDLKSPLHKVDPDIAFETELLPNGMTRADNAALILYECFFYKYPIIGYSRRLDDDEDTVIKTLSTKTKAQMKAVYDAFARKYGRDLDEFLKSYSSKAEYQQYATIIKNLK